MASLAGDGKVMQAQMEEWRPEELWVGTRGLGRLATESLKKPMESPAHCRLRQVAKAEAFLLMLLKMSKWK